MPTYIIHYDSGDSRGPFNIFLSGSYGLSPYASNITRQQLEGGYSVTVSSLVNSSSVEVFDMSIGCNGSENLPFPSPSPSKTPSVTATPSITPSITISPSITPSLTATPSVTPSVTPPPSISPSATPSVTPSSTPGASPSITPTPSITRTPSSTPPAIPGTLYMGSCTGWSQAYLACGDVTTCIGYYLPASFETISIGNVLYTDPGCTIPVWGNDYWYVLSYQGVGAKVAYQIDINGVVLDIYNCY